MRKIRLLFFLFPLLFNSCQKASRMPNEFKVTGVKDLDMSKSFDDHLALNIAVTSGIPETVTLSATGLPPGVEVSFDPASGLPGFNSTVFVNSSVAGTFPINIVGNSASYTKSYKLMLTTLPMNGWRFDGVYNPRGGTVRFNPGMGFYSGKNADEIILESEKAFPTADGVYTYTIGGYPAIANQLVISYTATHSSTYRTDWTNHDTLTMTVVNNKVRVKAPTMLLHGNDTKKLSIDLTE